jgi:hypothetical protein
MAAEETIVLEVFFDTEQAAANAVSLKKAIQDLKDQQKVLQVSGKELSEEYLQNTVELKRLTSEYRSNEQQLVKLNQAKKAEQGSNEQLRAQLSVLTAQYNKLSQEQRDSTVGGQLLQRQIKNISDQLKGTEGAVGDFRRNVGDYEGAVIRAANSLTTLRERLKELDEEINNTDIGSDRFREASDEAANLRLQIDQATGKVDEFGNREPKNPIKRQFEDAVVTAGLLGSAFTALSVQFSDNEQAQEKLAQAAAGVNVALNVANIIKEKGAIIDTITLAQTKALTAAQGAYAVVVGTSTGALKLLRVALAATGIGLLVIGLVELITNFDKVKRAVFNFLPGLESFVDGIGEAITVVTDFLGLTDSQTDALGRQETQVQRLIRAEERRLDLAKQTFDQRRRLLEAAGKDTEALAIEEEKFFRAQAERQIAFIQANISRFGAAGQSFVQAAQAQITRLQDEVRQRSNEITALQIEASVKATEEQKKIDEKRLKDREDLAKRIKAIVDEQFTEESQARQEAAKKATEAEKKRREEELAALKAQADSFVQFDLDRIGQQTLLRAQAAQANIDLVALEQEGILIKTQEGLTNLLLIEQQYNGNRKALVEDYYAFIEENGLISLETYLQTLAQQVEATNQAYEQQIGSAIQFGQQLAQILGDTIASQEQDLKQFSRSVGILLLDTLQKTVNVSIAQIVAKEIASKSFAGIATAAALSALVNTAFAAAKAVINKPVQGFAEGVIGLNGPGTETSDSIPAYLSRGESVIPAWGTRAIQSMYPGFLEQFVGAPKFANGVVNFQPTPSGTNDTSALLTALRQLPAPVVKVIDINKGQTDFAEVRVSTTI